MKKLFLSTLSLILGTMAWAQDVITVPEGVEAQAYVISTTFVYIDQDASGADYQRHDLYDAQLFVGFDGNDLYIQGLCESLPTHFSKATKNSEGKYVIPAGQFIGTHDALGMGTMLTKYYITAVDEDNHITDIILDYDEATGTISTDQYVVFNGSATKLQAYNWFTGIKLLKVSEREATPSKPQFVFEKGKSYSGADEFYVSYHVPLTDVEGRALNAEKVSFMFLRTKDEQTETLTFTKDLYHYIKEDMSVIPFGYTEYANSGIDFGPYRIYFNFGGEEMGQWSALGLQTIYCGADVEHRSEVYWFDLDAFWEGGGISQVEAPVASTDYFDLQGRRVPGDARGLVLQKVRRADGTTTTTKVFRR